MVGDLALVDDGAVGVERADGVLLAAQVDADGYVSGVRAEGRACPGIGELVGVAADFLDVVFVVVGSERITMLAHPSLPSHLILFCFDCYSAWPSYFTQPLPLRLRKVRDSGLSASSSIREVSALISERFSGLESPAK